MIDGNKILLESVEREHIEQFRNWRNNPQLRKYFRQYLEISTHSQEEWFQRSQDDNCQVNFSIKDRSSRQLIGHCGLYHIDWISRTAEFGIYIGEESYRKGGFGTDSLKSLINYGFSDLNLNKIWCEVYDNNTSINVYKRLGFVHEGTMRENYYNEGRYWDSHFLSVLSREWGHSESTDIYPAKEKQTSNQGTIKEETKMKETLERSDKDIINDIQDIRFRNNTHWMDIVKLAFEIAPSESRDIFKKIKQCDEKVNQLLKELAEND